MKRIILVVTHLGSGSNVLCYNLAQSRIIQWAQDGIIYDDPSAIESILSIKHKYSSIVGLYVNEVVYNYQISHKEIYNFCDFLYFIRDPRTSINVLKLKDASFAVDYYIFRLRRIYEMAKETKGVFLTWNDLISGKGMPFLLKVLNLPENLEFQDIKSDKRFIDLPKSLLKKAEDAYELCLYRLNNIQQLLRC